MYELNEIWSRSCVCKEGKEEILFKLPLGNNQLRIVHKCLFELLTSLESCK